MRDPATDPGEDERPAPGPGTAPDPAPPPGSTPPLAREALARRKRREAALFLPVAAAILFASPLLDVLAGAGTIGGLPAAALAIFGAWFALIALTARLARGLSRDGGDG